MANQLSFLERSAVLFETEPKKLFLIDGVGAAFSAFLIGFVLIRLQTLLGISVSTLYLLAALPLAFALYDGFCYRKLNTGAGPFLKVLAIMNLLYCGLSITLTVFHFNTITILGLFYFATEILIVVILALIELKVASRLPDNSVELPDN